MSPTTDQELLARLKAVLAAQARLAELRDAAREAHRLALEADLAVSGAEDEVERALARLDLQHCKNRWRSV